jgi:cytidylate kinase
VQTATINIAIDGYSSCGKGTLAKFLAKHLGYKFIDSGAMYRAVTLHAMRSGADVEQAEQVVQLLHDIHIDFIKNEHTGRFDIALNHENVESEIRTLEVASKVSQVARIPEVRRFLVAMQQQIAANKGVVMDGRDIGTVVLPDAELKIFMTASPEVRAERRLQELLSSGASTTFDEVLDNLKSRDHIDSTRADSPLTLTDSYRVIDNSAMGIAEQNALALQWVDALRLSN